MHKIGSFLSFFFFCTTGVESTKLDRGVVNKNKWKIIIKNQVVLVKKFFCKYDLQKLHPTVHAFAFERPLRTSKVVGGAPLTEMAFRRNVFEKHRVVAQRWHMSQMT